MISFDVDDVTVINLNVRHFPKSLNWTATDTYADTYEIWNGTNLLFTGSWTSGENLNFILNNLNFE